MHSRRVTNRARQLLLILVGLPVSTGARAQQDVPHAAYIYPAGGRAGATFEAILGGSYIGGSSIGDPRAVHATGEGIHFEILEYIRPLNQGAFKELQNLMNEYYRRIKAGETLTPEEVDDLAQLEEQVATFWLRSTSVPAEIETVKLRVTIDPDAAAGNRELRLETGIGLSNPLVFQVGSAPEFSELSVREFVLQREIEEGRDFGRQEESDTKEDPGATPISTTPEVPTNVAIPCVLNGQLPPGDFDLYRFHATQGQRLVINAHARRLIHYVSDGVPGWFQAVLTLSDTNGNEMAYSDDYTFHPDPVIFCEIPKTGEYVVEIKDSIYRGRESFVYRIEIGELPFVTDIFPLGCRTGTVQTVDISGWNLTVSNLAVNAVTAGRIMVASNYTAFLPGGMPFVIDTLPEAMEVEPNDVAATAMPVSFPVNVNGRIDQPDDVDVYAFAATAGTKLVADVNARRLGSPLDSVIKLTTADGGQIAFADDWYNTTEGLLTHHADARIETVLPVDGTYYLHIADAQHQNGRAYAYRLRLETRTPDFELRAVPPSLNLRQDSTAAFTVYALRQHGCTNDIAIAATALPAGLLLSGGVIPGDRQSVQMTVTVTNAPRSNVVELALEGQALVNGHTVIRPVIPAQDLMQAFAYRHLVPSGQLLVCAWGEPNGFDGTLKHTGTLLIPFGGAVAVDADIPSSSFYGAVEVMLENEEQGITLSEYTLHPQHCELIFRCDTNAAHIGQRGNLVVEAISVKDDGIVEGKEQRKPEYVVLSSLPAIPYEVVPNTGYDIHASASGHGEVYPRFVTVPRGSNLTVRFSPEDWHHVETLTVDSQAKDPAGGYKFRNVESNHTLQVTFAPDLVGAAAVPAYWLAQYGIVTNQEAAVLDDPDDDEQPTWVEYVVGSNPAKWNTPFLLDGLSTDSGAATRTLHWASKEGRVYTVWGASNLTSEFSRISTTLSATPPVNTYIDEGPRGPIFFYRIQVGVHE